MPPKRNLSGQIEYTKRGIFEDLMQLLPHSDNGVARLKELVPRNPRDSVANGLHDRGNWMTDAKVGEKHNGLTLFKSSYSQRNACAPLSNIWQFDIGRLIVLGVFMDAELLIQIAKCYNPVTKCVKDINGKDLISITDDEIREVFSLNDPSIGLEKIDFTEFTEIYEAQRDYLRAGPLRQFLDEIGSMCVVSSSTPEPFRLDLFSKRLQEVYKSLTLILGHDEETHMPVPYMFMMV